MTGTDLFGLQTSRTQATREPEALLNAAKFAAIRCKCSTLAGKPGNANKRLIQKTYFLIGFF
jgi:hypothetical protein